MSNTNSWLAAAGYGAKAFSGLVGGSSQSNAMNLSAEFTKKQLLLNEQVSGIQENQALKRGQFEEQQSLERTAQTVSAQRAAQAASGVDVNTGTAQEIQRQTATIGAKDAMTIENNAWLQSWGYRVQGINEGTKAIMSELGNQGQNVQRESEINAFGDTMMAIRSLTK